MSYQQQNTTKPVAEQLQEPMKVVWNPEKMFLNGLSWAQMIADEEEKEEQERLSEEQERLKNIIAERRFLYSIGEYELEEGELLE
jgi:hypothetical protein